MADAVYSEGKKYEKVPELEEGIVAGWNTVSLEYIRIMYNSLSKRLISDI